MSLNEKLVIKMSLTSNWVYEFIILQNLLFSQPGLRIDHAEYNNFS